MIKEKSTYKVGIYTRSVKTTGALKYLKALETRKSH